MPIKTNQYSRQIQVGDASLLIHAESLDPGGVLWDDMEDAVNRVTACPGTEMTVIEIPALKLPIRISCSIENAAG